MGEQAVIAGGGRYDDLVEQLGGPKTPAVGFAMGIERIIEALKKEHIEVENFSQIDVYIAYQGEQAELECIKLSKELRKYKIKTYLNLSKRNLSGQLKHADRLNAKLTIIMGEEEVVDDVVTVRNMETGEQTKVQRSWVTELVLEKLKEFS